MNEVNNFAWPVTTVGKYDYNALCKCIEENKEKLKRGKIVIFGAGIRGTSFSIWLSEKGYKDIVFTDNNDAKVGGYINEFPIISYKDVERMKEEINVIISVENGYSLMEQLEKSGFIKNENYFFIENHLNEEYIKTFSQKGNFIFKLPFFIFDNQLGILFV